MENNFIVFNFFLTLLFFLSLNHISIFLKIYDHPNKRKIHKKPIPLIGGLLIYIILTINFFVFKNIDGYIFILSSLFFFIGLLDDIIKISAVIRLVVLSILSFIFLYSFKTYNINFLHFEGIGKVYLYSFSIFLQFCVCYYFKTQ